MVLYSQLLSPSELLLSREPGSFLQELLSFQQVPVSSPKVLPVPDLFLSASAELVLGPSLSVLAVPASGQTASAVQVTDPSLSASEVQVSDLHT